MNLIISSQGCETEIKKNFQKLDFFKREKAQGKKHGFLYKTTAKFTFSSKQQQEWLHSGHLSFGKLVKR
jgi:hypothetical protein